MEEDENVTSDAISLESFFEIEEQNRKRKRQKMMLLVSCALLVMEEERNRRQSQHVRDRIEWRTHVNGLHAEGAFYETYRMSEAAFDRLCGLMEPHCEVNEVMSLRSSCGKTPISIQLTLHCVIRWLIGSSWVDIRLTIGISSPSFYRIISKGMTAILKVAELSYKFPSTPEEARNAAWGFKSVSTHKLFDGCVGAVDGYFLETTTPREYECGNVKAFFSGHYGRYGVNVQAACDHRCRFISVAIQSPGGTNDIVAFKKSPLFAEHKNLPGGYYLVGDCAYQCSDQLLVPFSGQNRQNKHKDAFNFYLSQPRMRIEMTFGVMVNRWAILRRPLSCRLKNVGKVFLSITRLHNYCINESAKEQAHKQGTYENIDDVEDMAEYTPSDVTEWQDEGSSIIRDHMVEEIKRRGFVRPAHNVRRNADR
jgi:DDE superfamily endonuclease